MVITVLLSAKIKRLSQFLYYGTHSPPRGVLLQLNLWYLHLTVCGNLLTVQFILTNVFLVVVLLTEGDELQFSINKLESREGRLSLFLLFINKSF